MVTSIAGKRWLRFGLRSLLALTALIAILLAWLVNAAHAQSRAIALIHAAGGKAAYDFEVVARGDPKVMPDSVVLEPMPPWPRWLVRGLGVDFFANVVEVDLPDQGGQNVAQVAAVMDHLSCLPHLTDIRVHLAEDAHIPQLVRVPKLERLFLGRTVSAESIQLLHACPGLHSFTLRSPKMTDQHIEAIGRMQHVVSLKLHSPDLTDAKVERLLTLHPGLQNVLLQSDRVTDATLARFAAYPSVDCVVVAGGGFSAEGIENLKRQRPDCTVLDYSPHPFPAK